MKLTSWLIDTAVNSSSSISIDTGGKSDSLNLRKGSRCLNIIHQKLTVLSLFTLTYFTTFDSFTEALLLPTMKSAWMHRRINPFISRGMQKETSLYTHQSVLQQMLSELAQLNKGKSVNPRSPKQVSQLLYQNCSLDGVTGGTDKNTLLSIINAKSESDELVRQKRVANLVLGCREIITRSSLVDTSFDNSIGVSSLRGRESQVASFSTSTVNDEPKSSEGMEHLDDTNNIFIPKSPFQSLSPYEQTVLSLFSKNNKSSPDPYWIQPLLTLNKPTSRSLVRQLINTCPMGFDPNAKAHMLSSNNNTTQKKATFLLSFFREQKRYFTDAILLVRVGDFYETYGMS